MATATTVQTNYPVINAAVWRSLRKQFHESPPKGPVNASYLSTLLSYKEDAATQVVRQLKRLGLLDPDDSKLTERAYRWRDDKQYKAVCEEIIEEVYPVELRDLFHIQDVPRGDVERWFRNTTKSGVGTSANYARFYMMLLDGDPAKLEATPAASKPGKSGSDAARASTRKAKSTKPATDTPSARPTATDSNEPDHDEHGHRAAGRRHFTPNFAPDLHLNIQIQIMPDSSAEQIDLIFASMAKHLRALVGEASE